jgi:predicted ATPase
VLGVLQIAVNQHSDQQGEQDTHIQSELANHNSWESHFLPEVKKHWPCGRGVQEEVPLRKLSSGEQNLIILYYKLAFSTDMRTVLLIDEPENSLHMAWVSQMLEDYQKMAEELKCQIIIATHSPAFINEHWDISCDLYTNNEENNHAEFAECK